MGSLALAGALAGFGKGMVANAEYQQKVDFAALEEARAMRVAQWEQGQLDARESRRAAAEAASTERQAELGMKELETRAAFDTSKQLLENAQTNEREKGKQTFEAGQNKLDRESRLAEARIRADAAGGGGGGGLEFTMGDVKTTVFKDGVAMSEKTLPGLFEKTTGSRFAQLGDQLFLVTVDADGKNIADRSVYDNPKTKRPGGPALAYLAAHPETFQTFQHRYGFVPVGWYSSGRRTRNTPDNE